MSPLVMATLVVAAVLGIAIILLIVGDYRLVTRLRRDHPVAWQGIGSPSPWFTRLEDVNAVYRFLEERAYLRLGDADLSQLAGRLRMLTNVVFLLAAATLVMMA